MGIKRSNPTALFMFAPHRPPPIPVVNVNVVPFRSGANGFLPSPEPDVTISLVQSTAEVRMSLISPYAGSGWGKWSCSVALCTERAVFRSLSIALTGVLTPTRFWLRLQFPGCGTREKYEEYVEQGVR